MTKAKRQKIFEKYSGHCAYCGSAISLQDMQADHIVPKAAGGKDSIENLNPSCRICNHYKRSEQLEIWRKYFLGELIKRLRKIYIFKVAERYGMVQVKEWNKKFYFEKQTAMSRQTSHTKALFPRSEKDSAARYQKYIQRKKKSAPIGAN